MADSETKEQKLMVLVARLDKDMQQLIREREELKQTVSRLQSECKTSKTQNTSLLEELSYLQAQNQELDMSVEALEMSKAKAAAEAAPGDADELKEENAALVLSLRGASMVLDQLESKSKEHDRLLVELRALPPLVAQYDHLVRSAQDIESSGGAAAEASIGSAALFDETLPMGPERAQALADLLKELNSSLELAWQERREQLHSLVDINGRMGASLQQAEQAGKAQAQRAADAEEQLQQVTAELKAVHMQDEERAREAAHIAEEKAKQHEKDATLRDLTRAVSSLTATVENKMDTIRKLNMALYEAEHASATEAEKLARQHAAERAQSDLLRQQIVELEQQLASKFAEGDQHSAEIQRLGRELEGAAERERSLQEEALRKEQEMEQERQEYEAEAAAMREVGKDLRDKLENSRDQALLERTQAMEETVNRLRASRGTVAQQITQLGALTDHLAKLVASGSSSSSSSGGAGDGDVTIDLENSGDDLEEEDANDPQANGGRGLRSDISLAIKARNLLNLDTMKPYSPVVVAFTQAEGDGEKDWAYAGKTEWLQANSDADFKTKLAFASYPMGPDTLLKLTVYDADGVSIQDENIIGHVIVSLRQIVDSGREHVRGMQPLRHSSKRKQKALSKAKSCLLLTADVQLEQVQKPQQQQAAGVEPVQELSALDAEEAAFAARASREIARFAKLNTKLRDQIASREAELDRLGFSFQRGNDELSQENEDLRNSLAEVNLQLQHARQEADSLTRSLEGTEAEAAKKDRQIADLKRTMEALSSHANRLQDLNEGAVSAEVEAEVKDARIEQLQAALDAARSDLEREQEVSAGLQRELQGMMRSMRQY